jgi:AraC-like DNA-binding protein
MARNNSVYIAINDRQELIDLLNRFITNDFSEVIFTREMTSAELTKYTSPYFRIILLTDQKHTYKILGKDNLHDVCLYPEKALFCQRRGVTKNNFPDDEKEWETLTLAFWPGYIRFLRSRYRSGNGWLHFWYNSSNAVNQPGIYILKTLDELVLAEDSDEKACLLVKTLLHVCRDNLIKDNPRAVTKSFRTYQNIKAYLYENSDENINRESVADIFKISPSHISKLFAEYSEQGFNATLKTLRLEHALELLKNTEFSIAEIAEQCGFINTGYFIKVFKLSYGHTPYSFRNKIEDNIPAVPS